MSGSWSLDLHRRVGVRNDSKPSGRTQSMMTIAAEKTDQTWDASHAPTVSLPSTAAGWSISMPKATTATLSERVITDPVATPSGAVFFTSFIPSSDVCKYGGDSRIWSVSYSTGFCPPCSALSGKALIQVSTGAFEEINLKDTFCCVNKIGEVPVIKPPSSSSSSSSSSSGGPPTLGPPGNVSGSFSGVPPTAQGLTLVTSPPPAKKFLHVKEK